MTQLDQDALEAETPMRDLLKSVADELMSGWRARSEPRDQMASHQWGDDVSIEVGRIITAYLAPSPLMQLTFADLRRANEDRQAYWGGSENWTLADWSNALAGEVGEACNLVKKIRRPELGTTGNSEDVTAYRTALKTEIGDVLVYLDLLAKATGATLQECAETAFNSKSEKLGMPIRLGALHPDPTQAKDEQNG